MNTNDIFDLNAKGTKALSGAVDYARNSVFPCQVDPTFDGVLMAGNAVSLVTANSVNYPVVTAYTDESVVPYGYVTYDSNNINFAGGAMVNIARANAVINLTAGQYFAANAPAAYDAESGKMLSPAAATSAQWTSKNFTQISLAPFWLVTDGEFALKVGGAAQVPFTGMNFLTHNSLTSIINVIQEKLGSAFLVTQGTGGRSIVIRNATAGAAGNFVMEPVTGGTGTDLTGSTYLDNAKATVTGGAAAGQPSAKAYVVASGDGVVSRFEIIA